MKNPDSAIKKTYLSEIVAKRILKKISSGEVKPGNRLSSERDLALELGVSRTVVRQSIQILAKQGDLEIRDGKAYAKEVTLDRTLAQYADAAIVDEQQIIEFMEIRMLLEHYVIRKAVYLADEEAIQQMQNAIDLMRLELIEDRTGYEQENNFHGVLIGLVNNSAIKSIYSLSGDLLRRPGRESLKAARDAGKPITAVLEHQGILDAIKNRDEATAVRLMDEHLQRAYMNLCERFQIKYGQKVISMID